MLAAIRMEEGAGAQEDAEGIDRWKFKIENDLGFVVPGDRDLRSSD